VFGALLVEIDDERIAAERCPPHREPDQQLPRRTWSPTARDVTPSKTTAHVGVET
jgi:hypothetical protein